MDILQGANFHRIGGAEMRRFEPEDCFVAEIEGKVVGVAGYAILDPVTAKTTLLAVDRSVRRQGVGIALQRCRLAYLRQQGIRTVYTNCDDPAVIAWNCRHFGFYPTGRMIKKEEPFGLPDKDSWTNLRLDLDPNNCAALPCLPATRDPNALVHDLTEPQADAELQGAVFRIVSAMRRDQERFLRDHFRPDTAAAEAVAEESLTPLLANAAWVSDIVEDRRISNCIAYNFDNVDGAVMDDELGALRGHLDAVMLSRARALFPQCPDLTVENTGHFWYPNGGYMGWHTNLRTPGWRCYITIADEPGRSFFRYRHPDGRVITSWDRTCDVRLFNITPSAPLWHAVYSETNRFSLGYKFLLA
jgi:GNAT superfamily N-acetyltransferase